MKKPTEEDFYRLIEVLKEEYGVTLSGKQQVELILNPDQNGLLSWYRFLDED